VIFSKPIVEGVGPKTSPLWFIGRDLGETEERKKEPFVGRAGQILNDALKEAGIVREHIYIDNLVPVRPPNNVFEAHLHSDLVAGEKRLYDLIKKHKPKVIVALGNEASCALINEYWPKKVNVGIRDVRGYLFRRPFFPTGKIGFPVTILATVHPSGCDREWVPWRKLLSQDIKKAKRELDAGCPAFPKREVIVVTEIFELQSVRDAMRSAKWVAMDIENDKDDLSCLGIAVREDLAFVIPAVKPWQITAIKEFCEGNKPKVFQNGQYDRYFLKTRNNIVVKHHVFDDMLAWHALQPELAGAKEDSAKKKKATRKTEKSLRFLASVFTRDPWWKSYEFSSAEEQYELCGKDCCITLEVANILEKELN